jgi:hypothetical protein
MRVSLVLLISLVLVATLPPIDSGPQIYASVLTLNWSGYIVAADSNQPRAITGATTTITVPVLSKEMEGKSAIWVGVGGANDDNHLIQAGVEANQNKNGPEYYAWYELFPEPQTRILMSVRAGDNITISLQLLNSQWNVTINNLTAGQNFTTSAKYESSMSSAEWILEAPTVCETSGCTIASLPRFDIVTFSRSSVIVHGISCAPGHAWYESIVLVKLQNNLATPVTQNSPLLNGGTGFHVLSRYL